MWVSKTQLNHRQLLPWACWAPAFTSEAYIFHLYCSQVSSFAFSFDKSFVVKVDLCCQCLRYWFWFLDFSWLITVDWGDLLTLGISLLGGTSWLGETSWQGTQLTSEKKLLKREDVPLWAPGSFQIIITDRFKIFHEGQDARQKLMIGFSIASFAFNSTCRQQLLM